MGRVGRADRKDTILKKPTGPANTHIDRWLRHAGASSGMCLAASKAGGRGEAGIVAAVYVLALDDSRPGRSCKSRTSCIAR
jgi:hypothetical protein